MGKPIQQGLVRDQMEKAGIKIEEFMGYYK